MPMPEMISVEVHKGNERRCPMSGKCYTRDEWLAEGVRLFGSGKENIMRWRFKCPRCGNIATIQEFKDAGAKEADEAVKKCIGRFTSAKGCDWTAYGLLDICTVHVDGIPVFEFAPYETDEKGGAK